MSKFKAGDNAVINYDGHAHYGKDVAIIEKNEHLTSINDGDVYTVELVYAPFDRMFFFGDNLRAYND